MPDPTDELYRTVVELLPEGVLALDRTARIMLANPAACRALGYDPSQLVGMYFAQLIAPADRGRVSERLEEAHAEHDVDAIRRDETEVRVDLHIIPFGAADDRLALVLLSDANERRKLQEQRRHYQKLEAIGTLAQGVAHDFNNILRAIVGYVELARASVLDPQALQDLERVRDAADRGQHLVERILAFGPQRELTRTPTRLNNAIQSALDELRQTLPSSAVIHSRLADDAPATRIDETQVHDILMHLVMMGIQTSTGKTTIDVELTPFTGGPEFERVHPGSGAERYARLAVSMRRRNGRSHAHRHAAAEPAVNLAIVSGIVRALGGAVDIERRGEDMKVVLYFPAARSPARHEPEGRPDEAPAQTAASAEPGPHILFVEDEETLAELGRRQLQADGFHVTVHTSALSALEDFRARPDAFHLVITDNTMPKMSGMALAQEILRLRPRTRILLVSGLAETLDPGVIYAKGIAGLLPKPHSGRELTTAVRSLLELTDPPKQG
jgi:PAS domain S-box-containing protein